MAITVTGRRLGPLAILLLLSSGLRAAAADPPDLTYRTHANEVRLTFSVTDQNNHGVATLQPGDFAVVDTEFIVRNFQSFSHSDSTQLEIAILADASESVAPRFRQEISDLVELVSQTAGIPEKNLSIFSFLGSQPALLCAADCRTSHAAARLAPPDRGDLTPLFDTIVYASDFLSQHADRNAQKILIVLSDGQDTVSRNSLKDAVSCALRQAIQIYGIDRNHAFSSQGSAVLYRLATATGGRWFAGMDATASVMNVILEDFKASYIVTYKLPSHYSGFHSLRILPTHNSNLQFRSRSGYYFPDNIR
jgi:VWFA-related protein